MNDLWSFNYHKGPAMLNGVCRAADEVQALEVATAWCRANNCRPPAGIRPFILAGPEILGVNDATQANVGVVVETKTPTKFTETLKAAFGVTS
jgi:branched-subunit amino acid aminotransferase/4-amino-4-deoxychorismate lyase